MNSDDLGKRKSLRHPLRIDLSSVLFVKTGRAPVRCVGVDVSEEGLGIIGFEELGPQVRLILVLSGKEIPMRVVWCKSDSLRGGVFHAGLVCMDEHFSLIREFQAAGLLQIVSSWNFRVLNRK